MSKSDIEQSGTVKGRLPNGANLSGRISNGLSLSGHISTGSVASDFIIKMTVESNDRYFTVTSCDATIEQIDAAVAAEKRVVLIATDTARGVFELPIVQAYQGQTYIFIACTYSGYMMATVYKYGENEIWEFVESGFSAEAIDYFNSTQPDVESVHAALNKLFTNSHTHANKSVLDKFSETDGKPTYDGQALGGESTIYIPAKLIESDYDMPTIETSVTFEQIEAAYNLGRQQILKLVEEGSDEFIRMLPLVFASPGGAYYFETTINSRIIFAAVTPTNEWGLEFYDTTPTPKEEIVNDVLAALPTWTGGNY